MISSLNKYSYNMFIKNKSRFIVSLISVMISVALILSLYTAVDNIIIEFSNKNSDLDMNFLKVYVSIFSILVLMISFVIIKSNFQNILYRYRKELTIFKELGASQKQCLQVLLTQFTIVNLLGTLIGFIVAILFNRNILFFMINLMECKIKNYTINIIQLIIIALLIFILLELAIIISNFILKKMLPQKINKENERLEFKFSDTRKKISLTLIIVGMLLIILYTLNKTSNSFLWVFIGNISLIIGVLIGLAYFFNNILKKCTVVFRRHKFNNIYIALSNLLPNVRRNSVMISVITLTVAMGVFIFSFFNILYNNQVKHIRTQQVADIIVSMDKNYKDGTEFSKKELQEENEFKNKIVEEIKQIDNADIYVVYTGGKNVKIDGKIEFMNIGFIEGENGKLNKRLRKCLSIDNEIIISKDFSKEHNFNIGDTLEFVESEVDIEKGFNSNIPLEEIYNKSIANKEVKEISSEIPISYGDVILGRDGNENLKTDTFIHEVLINTDDLNYVKEKLESIKTNKCEELKYITLEDELTKFNIEFKSIYGIFFISIGVMIFCTILGAYNMFFDFFYLKRKEFAILRTLSLSKHNLLKIIFTEATICIFFGTIVGMILGSIMTTSMALADRSSFVTINTLFLIIIFFIFLIGSIIISLILYKITTKNKLVFELKEE